MAVQEWDITRTTYRVSDFVSWQSSGTLELSPSFQRRPVWQKGAKSYLIDTILRGLPIPLILLRELPSDLRTMSPKREVIDGQQRIRTVISYVAPHFLTDYREERDNFTLSRSHNAEHGGAGYRDLPSALQHRILDYQFSVHLFPGTVSDRDMLQIFARMNSTGVKLNSQELRNAKFFGAFKSAMYELAAEQLERWRSWGVFTEREIARMEEVQLVSEFVYLMFRGLAKRDNRALNRLYEEFDEEFDERPIVVRRFRTIMDEIDTHLGQEMSSMVLSRKTLIYSLFAAFYERIYGLGSDLAPVRAKGVDNDWVDWVREAAEAIRSKSAPLTVLEVTGKHTTDLESRRVLFHFLAEGPEALHVGRG